MFFGIQPNCYFTPLKEIPSNKTRYFKRSNTKGLFGYTTGACLVTETQQRHDLHAHILLFGSLSPALLQSAAPFPSICQNISLAIDKMYKQSIARNIHVANIITDELKSI